MDNRHIIPARIILVAGICVVADAPPVRAVSLEGWQCMSPSSVFGPQGTYAPPVPVYSGPQANAPQVGTAAGVILVPKPIHVINGRTETLRPDGKRAWIDANQLVPWRSLSDPAAVCRPALLSNGRYGFTTQ